MQSRETKNSQMS